MIKAIFFDIDGTLISFRTHTVPQATKDALREIRRKGIKTFIASGRPRAQITGLDGMEFDGYITLNGAYCLDKEGAVIHKSALPEADLAAMVEYQRQRPFPVILVGERNISINFVNEQVDELSRFVAVPPPPVRNLGEAASEEVFQATVYVDKEWEPEVMSDVFPGCQGNRWHPYFVDVNRQGTDKAGGIDRVLERYGISLDETMAFGDGGNDIAMLRHVGIGVAMGNASDAVKAQADYVTASVDEEGIPNALRHFQLLE